MWTKRVGLEDRCSQRGGGISARTTGSPSLKGSRWCQALYVAVLIVAPATASSITVETIVDADVADGLCSLREAILAANSDASHQECAAGSGTDTIFLPYGTVILSGPLPVISESVTLVATDFSRIDGADQWRILEIDSATDDQVLTVLGAELQDGYSTGDGAAVLVGEGDQLTLVDSEVEFCHSDASGGALAGLAGSSISVERSVLYNNSAASGAGVAIAAGTLTVVDSTLSFNLISIDGTFNEGSGGAVHAEDSTVVVERSTIYYNSATHAGGGIYVRESELTVSSSTLYANRADLDADGASDGGGIFLSLGSTLTLHNSIVAGNEDRSPISNNYPDIAESASSSPQPVVVSLGFNLIGNNDGASIAFPSGSPNINGDWVGAAVAPIDPLLSSQLSGGLPVVVPLTGSPAIDQGACPGEVADQRGYGNVTTLMRPVDDGSIPDFADGCDIGAIEIDGVLLDIPFFADGFESGDTLAWN